MKIHSSHSLFIGEQNSKQGVRRMNFHPLSNSLKKMTNAQLNKVKYHEKSDM